MCVEGRNEKRGGGEEKVFSFILKFFQVGRKLGGKGACIHIHGEDDVDRGTTPCFSTPLSNPDNKVPLNLAYHRANIRFAEPVPPSRYFLG